jgi:hypothetical protein
MLECFKTINGHVSKNILKRRYNVMDGFPFLGPRATNSSTSFVKLEGSNLIPNASLNLKGL